MLFFPKNFLKGRLSYRMIGNKGIAMPTLSLCMIVRNEEEVIGRCLDSIQDCCDEIIICDTGSTDKTVEIVSKYPQVKVVHFTWVDDFAAARNFSFQHATKDLILWLDADDII